MRLFLAAKWRVMQAKNVLQYGKLEEYLSSVSETAPGLLSYRHRAVLTLGLRAWMILELCHSQEPPNPVTILHHLDRIKPPLCKGVILCKQRIVKREEVDCKQKVSVDGPHLTIAVSDLVDVELWLGSNDSVNSRFPPVG
ncbi:hypothetical protein AAFF_G00429470 [Aldrovandia affinis]|uniref:TERF1-interacting nuclear factor 2 N-terminal domain-containing protein n=1 Tax=Aldrovandia affinis TaxID=143900 RepID=A0AAD7R3N5_9TELE|nr:hypothetical protein AAFF_G00429470 [Aldrovandia affinis]